MTRSNTQPEQGRGTTTALVEGRVRLAERIVAAELGSAGLRSPADSTATQVLLFHAPVAGDLRTVVAVQPAGWAAARRMVKPAAWWRYVTSTSW